MHLVQVHCILMQRCMLYHIPMLRAYVCNTDLQHISCLSHCHYIGKSRKKGFGLGLVSTWRYLPMLSSIKMNWLRKSTLGRLMFLIPGLLQYFDSPKKIGWPRSCISATHNIVPLVELWECKQTQTDQTHHIVGVHVSVLDLAPWHCTCQENEAMSFLRQYPAENTHPCNIRSDALSIWHMACKPSALFHVVAKNIYRQRLSLCCTVTHIHRRMPATYWKVGTFGSVKASRNCRKVPSPSGMCNSESPVIELLHLLATNHDYESIIVCNAWHSSYCCMHVQYQTVQSIASRSTLFVSLGSASRIVDSSSAIWVERSPLAPHRLQLLGVVEFVLISLSIVPLSVLLIGCYAVLPFYRVLDHLSLAVDV